MDHDKLLTAAELADRLNISVATVYKMCKGGKWPHSKIGRLYRFTEEHYQSIIETPVVPLRRPRTQRENIARLLRSTSYDG
jgi:excisionase family DNA binding protein